MTQEEIYSARYGDSWAIIIGINEYRAAPNLGYAKNDAEEFAHILQDRFSFKDSKITLLLDESATRAAITSSISRLANETGSDDRVVFFFAGHGYTHPGKRGEVGFLVPHDGDRSDLSTLVRWGDLTSAAELVPVKHLMFIMDACYGGLAIMRSLPPGAMRFVKDMLQRYSRQVLTAGKADEVVSDAGGPRPGHFVFTGHLLNALSGDAASPEGIITANGVMAHVYERVSKDYQSRQTPHFGFIDGDGDLIFELGLAEKLSDDATKGKDLLIAPSPPSSSTTS